MQHTVETSWKGNMMFDANVSGHHVIMDAQPAVGGEDRGSRPKELMLASLAGCTGMDVVSILKKMRVEISGLNILVTAEATEEHPKHYVKMHVVYQFSGKDPDMAQLKKAVQLSQDRYCGVSYVYKKAMEITWEIQVNP